MKHIVSIDFESSVSKMSSLSKQSLRQYLDTCRLLGMAVALDDEEPVWFVPGTPEWDSAIEDMRRLALDPEVCFVAHSYAFELRVMTYKLGLPPPRHGRCTMEAAMCAFPNHPGGYSLGNLAKTLRLGGEKTGSGDKVMKMTAEELEAYCVQDTRLARALYRICDRRVAPEEWRIAELCNRVRECYLDVDMAAVAAAVTGFTDLADGAMVDCAAVLDDGDSTAFGRDELGHARSVKPHKIKALLLDHLGFDTPSISAKKINPVALALNPEAALAVKHAGAANKALSNKRKVGVFHGLPRIDMELGFYRAHTGRFSSPGTGKGLNLHNLSKHDPKVSKLFRSMFKLPADLCFVRADEANVEYRVAGLLSRCPHIHRLFTANIFADPYSAFGQSVTGQPIQKKDPIRQLFKMAVLGLSYGMGLYLWTKEVLKELAKPPRVPGQRADLTIDDLARVCQTNGWQFPNGKYAARILRETGCDPIVLTAAFHTREAFHRVHPEFRQLADWLMSVCEETSRAADPASMIDQMYTMPTAPARHLIDVRYTDEFEGRSLRITCANWPHSGVVWRDLGVREIPIRGVCLSVMSGNKGYRAISPSICLENCVQHAARNATCQAKLALEDRYPYILSVHDELMPIVPRTREAVLQCRKDLLDVMGPNRLPGWGWSILINPEEINVSQSLYEVDLGKFVPSGKNLDWWAALEAGQTSLLDTLP